MPEREAPGASGIRHCRYGWNAMPCHGKKSGQGFVVRDQDESLLPAVHSGHAGAAAYEFILDTQFGEIHDQSRQGPLLHRAFRGPERRAEGKTHNPAAIVA